MERAETECPLPVSCRIGRVHLGEGFLRLAHLLAQPHDLRCRRGDGADAVQGAAVAEALDPGLQLRAAGVTQA